MHIAVCSNDGLHCTYLVNEDVHKPRGIALHPQAGTMYWSDWGDHPMIARSFMDGSAPIPFVDTEIVWPNGVTLDWPNDRLYWVDAKLKRIESIHLNGHGRKIVLGNVIKHPYGIAVFENNIYWSDWDTKSIQTCDKFNCKNHETVAKDRKIFDIHVYHASIQPAGNHACIGNLCSHICLLSGNSSFTCGCPKGQVLNVDKITCSYATKRQTIYIGIHNYLIALEHQTFGRNEPGKGEALAMVIDKMAYNLLTGNLFAVDNTKRVIYSVDVKTKATKELVKQGIGNVSALAFGEKRFAWIVGVFYLGISFISVIVCRSFR